jgi:hypothetical protein
MVGRSVYSPEIIAGQLTKDSAGALTNREISLIRKLNVFSAIKTNGDVTRRKSAPAAAKQ